MTSDRWVLGTLERGYAIEFTGTPPSDMRVRPTPIPTDPSRRIALEREIQSLLEEKAVRDVLQTEGRAGRTVLAAASRASFRAQGPLQPGTSQQ